MRLEDFSSIVIGVDCWGLRRGRDLESWADGICLLDERVAIDCRELSLGSVRWLLPLLALAKASGLFHVKLGKSVG
jgi:hypothetical protein